MDSEQRARYDAARNLAEKGFRAGCYAPFTSMYLDPAGDVRACCQNVEHVLGNVGRESLLDIWRGERAGDLRAAMVAYDMSLGCRFCQWQFDDGNFEGALAHDFDGLAVPSPDAIWPQRLELAISNTCNLECVMCDGDLSSRIRTRREHRPPLPKVYDDGFFDDLTHFLPHLVEVRFLGGEPFLARETFRVWDLMAEADLHTPCKVTTNGTQWNERVERVLDRFPVSIAVSLDGVTPATVEAIRVGASHDELITNLGRFREYTRSRGTDLELTYCLMQANWREFGDYLLFGDAWGCRVSVNTVIREPFSLYQLPLPEFEALVATLERRGRRLRRKLSLNRDVWDTELDRLRHWRDQTRAEVRAREVPATIRRRATYFQPAPDPPAPAARATATGPAPPAAGADRAAGDGRRPRGGARAMVPRPPDPRVSTRVEPLPPVLAEAPVTPGCSVETATALAEETMGSCRTSFIVCDPDDRALEVGPGTDFLGLPADRCVGRPYVEVVTEASARLGAPAVMHEDLRDACVVRRLRFGPRRGESTYVQAVAFPVAMAGRDDRSGSVTVAAATTVAPAWAAPTPP